MIRNWEPCFASVMREEGGYVNNPKDPGGATNHGVTKHVWESWIGHPVSDDDMKRLTIDDVKPLYKQRYWDVCRCDELPDGVDFVVFDTAVNSGTTKAARLLQQMLSIPVDGVIGPKTVAAAKEANSRNLSDRYCDARLAYLKGLGTWPTFGDGWGARISQLRASADLMA